MRSEPDPRSQMDVPLATPVVCVMNPNVPASEMLFPGFAKFGWFQIPTPKKTNSQLPTPNGRAPSAKSFIFALRTKSTQPETLPRRNDSGLSSSNYYRHRAGDKRPALIML